MRLELLMILMLLVGFARLHDTCYHSGRLKGNARGQSLLSASPLVLPPSVSPIIGRSLEKGGSALHALLSRDYVSLPAAGGEACAQCNVTLSRILAARGNGNTLAADTAEEFRSARPFVICMRCGCYATTHARSLRNACLGAPRTGAGHAALRRTARRTDSSRCACIAKRWSLTEARRISIGTFVPNTCGAAQKCKKLFGRAVVDPSGYGRSAVRRCVSKRSLYSAECASADDQNKDTATLHSSSDPASSSAAVSVERPDHAQYVTAFERLGQGSTARERAADSNNAIQYDCKSGRSDAAAVCSGARKRSLAGLDPENPNKKAVGVVGVSLYKAPGHLSGRCASDSNACLGVGTAVAPIICSAKSCIQWQAKRASDAEQPSRFVILRARILKLGAPAITISGADENIGAYRDWHGQSGENAGPFHTMQLSLSPQKQKQKQPPRNRSRSPPAAVVARVVAACLAVSAARSEAFGIAACDVLQRCCNESTPGSAFRFVFE